MKTSSKFQELLNQVPQLNSAITEKGTSCGKDWFTLSDTTSPEVWQTLNKIGWFRFEDTSKEGQTKWAWSYDPENLEQGIELTDEMNAEITAAKFPPSKEDLTLIVTGRISEETRSRIIELLKNEPARTEFVSNEDSSLGPKITEAIRLSNQVIDLFEEYAAQFSTDFHYAVRSFHSVDSYKLSILWHLCDRVAHNAIHVSVLQRESPSFSYIDAASLNRSAFEAAVNCLYLLHDEKNERLAQLVWQSFKEDSQMRKRLTEWITHGNKAISEAAKMTLSAITIEESDVKTLLDAIGCSAARCSPLPRIEDRCVGEVWQSLYAMRYKQLCGWSHIHLDTVFYSPSNISREEKDVIEGINRGIAMACFGWHLLHLFTIALCEKHNAGAVEIRRRYCVLMAKVNALLGQSGAFTSGTFISECDQP